MSKSKKSESGSYRYRVTYWVRSDSETRRTFVTANTVSEAYDAAAAKIGADLSRMQMPQFYSHALRAS